MYVKAAPGLVIRDPLFRDLLPPEGRDVPDDSDYWQRRLLDGDVVPAAPPDAASRSATLPAAALTAPAAPVQATKTLGSD